jgi:hypothetical protein
MAGGGVTAVAGTAAVVTVRSIANASAVVFLARHHKPSAF